MDLLEYQAKQLFTQVEIPVLPSQSLLSPSDLKNLQIPYPVVLKSQVLASERIKYGGVRFVENTIDAIAVAQSLFNLSIQGEYPQVVLAEAQYDAENELFLGVMVDYNLKKPVLLGSAYGGDNTDLLLKNLQRCVIEDEFSPFYARHLATQIGLKNKAIVSFSRIIEKMYELLVKYDLDLVEINPLGINQDGEFMALDGKIRVNDHALNRHPDLWQFLNLELNAQTNRNNIFDAYLSSEIITSMPSHQIDNNGNIALITDNLDQSIFINKYLQKEKLLCQQNYILPLKTELFWKNNIYKILLKVIQSDNIKTVVVNHDNQDCFIDILLDKITSYYQSDNDLSTEERYERATGMRPQASLTPKTSSSSMPKRKINWLIRNLAFTHDDEKISAINQLDNLPIQFITNLETIVDLIKQTKGK